MIINSLPNMKKSWNETCNKNDLKIPFIRYKKLIGLPFLQILKKLYIKNDFKKIQQDYKFFSIKFKNLIKCFLKVKKIINILKKKKFKIVIITSKDRKRSIMVLKKEQIRYDMLITPDDVKKGKPYTYSTTKIIKKYSIKKNDILFIGDTIHDYEFAKNSKIDFMFANWGYGSIKLRNVNVINSPSEILKKLDENSITNSYSKRFKKN